jgi:hypothetical protein
MSNGTIDLGQLLRQATTDDKDAVMNLFKGFLADNETITECGYLGTLGLIFTEHSFWCVTSTRVCSLRLKRGGEMTFSSGYLEYINSDAFYQPSLILLWVLIGGVALITWGIGLLLAPLIVKQFYNFKKSGAVFWISEGIPVYIFADRQNLRKAQKIPVHIARNKRNLRAA